MRMVLASTLSLSLAALLAACSSSPEVMTHAEELAVCLATDEPVPFPAIRDELDLPDTPGEPSPEPVPDPVPVPGDDDELTARCCTAPDCFVHDYPPGTCTSVGTQPTSEEEVVVAETIRKRWNGPELRTMIIDGCETDDDGGDEPGDGPSDGDDGGDDPGDCDGQIFYFNTGGEVFDYVAWLEDFDTDGDGRPNHTDIVVADTRDVEAGAKIRNERGTEVFPLVRAGHQWQREDAPVLLPDGPDEDTEEDEYFLDEQNDCFRVDAVELDCGTVYICWIC